MQESDNRSISGHQAAKEWCVGKVKFYDTTKVFGFARDLTVADYTEKEDDVYIGGGVPAPHELVDDAYIAFRKVPSSRKPGTFKAEDVCPLHDYPGDLDPLVEEVASPSERDELRNYLESERASWQIGKVKFFDSNKGFGFIQPLKPLDVLDGDDAYVNERNVEAESLSDNTHVAFCIAPSRKPGEYQAVSVQTLREFDRPSISFAEDLALWILGGGNLNPNVPVIAHLMSQSDVSEVLDLIEMIAWTDDERPERKQGTDLRLLGNVLEKAEAKEFLRPEEADRVWGKYNQEVGRLVDHDVIPSSVASMLWVEGLLPTLEPEAIDALVDRVWEDDWSDQIFDLSYHSYRSRSLRETKLRDIVQRFSQDDLANWVDRQTQTIDDTLASASENAVSLLDKHLAVLRVVRKKEENGSAQDVDRYGEAITRIAQHCHERDELTRDQSFSLWKNGFLAEIGYSEFVEGYADRWKREHRVNLLQRLESERRRQFATRRTKELLEAWEDSAKGGDDTLSRWLEDVEFFSETVASETGDAAAESLLDQCEAVLREEATAKAQVALYGEGHLSSVPEEWLLQNASRLSRSDLEPILERTDSEYAKKVLKARLEALSEIVESDDTSTRESDFLSLVIQAQRSKHYPEARWLLVAAKRTLTDTQRAEFASALADRIDVPTHAQLYQEEHLNVDPQPRIVEYLDDLTVDAIDTAESWVEDGTLDIDAFANILCAHLQDVQVRNRETARCVQSAVRRLADHAPGRLTLSDVASETTRAVIRLTRWIDNEPKRHEEPDFGLPLLQRGLCWLLPKDQVTALRKVFHLHAQQRLTLSPEKLTACSSFQLQETDEQEIDENPQEDPPALGLSAELIIQTIRHAAKTGNFPREGYLIQIVRHVTRDDPSRNVQLQDIFNGCDGRSELRMSPKRGEVKEVVQNGRRTFVISFDYDESLVSSVKRLPGRRYNPDQKVWIVPAEKGPQREATFQFARDYNFFINLKDGKHWGNNSHIVKTESGKRPHGVKYCEGRKAKRKDFGVYDFWWCRNGKCYSSCHGRHEDDNWRAYTLEDFLALLDLYVDEDLPNETIEMGQYHRFLGWINRFAQLLDRLYCRECGHILDASRSANYSHYRVTNFQCANTSCSKYSQEIYLHHCFNPKCGSVIDSRDSTQCPNGWWICTNDNCGACCSHEEMVQRRDRLHEVGQYIPRGLNQDIKKKVGHLERAQHFCYECGKEMEEKAPKRFHCPDGHVEYDLKEADFDRPHRDLEE